MNIIRYYNQNRKRIWGIVIIIIFAIVFLKLLNVTYLKQTKNKIENNNFETGYGSISNTAIIQNDQNNENTINNPLDKIMELNKQTTDLFERMLAVEKEKSALLEQLLKKKEK